MGKLKIRDEQKGVIFIALIIVTAIALSIVFAFSLKTNIVETSLKNNEFSVRFLLSKTVILERFFRVF